MNIGVFFGGKSPEHDVSIITGQLIISELKRMGRTVIPVYIAKDGRWHIDDALGSLKFFQRGDKDKTLRGLAGYNIDLAGSQGKLVFEKGGLIRKKITIDLAFPAFHGSYGEDGTIQGLFEMFNVPYVGCGVPASVIAFDKILTKRMYASQEIPTTRFIDFARPDWEKDKGKILADIKSRLKFPLFVKPPLLGSSIGISKAKDEKELEFGIEVALHYGNTVLVEEGVENLMDITCCVIGNDQPQPSLVQESTFSSDLFDFEEKYLKDGGAQLGKAQSSIIIPARLDADTTEAIQSLAMKIYRLVGCTGIARVDFLFDKETKQHFANEINPLPGTLYHHLWKASGVGLDQLLEKLIGFALERHKQKERIKYTFDSSLLESTKSAKLKLKGD